MILTSKTLGSISWGGCSKLQCKADPSTLSSRWWTKASSSTNLQRYSWRVTINMNLLAGVNTKQKFSITPARSSVRTVMSFCNIILIYYIHVLATNLRCCSPNWIPNCWQTQTWCYGHLLCSGAVVGIHHVSLAFLIQLANLLINDGHVLHHPLHNCPHTPGIHSSKLIPASADLRRLRDNPTDWAHLDIDRAMLTLANMAFTSSLNCSSKR